MLTLVANLVTKFERVVFGSYFHILCRTLLHAWSNSTPSVSISSCTCSIQIFHKCMVQNMIFLLRFIPMTCSYSREHVQFYTCFSYYGRLLCAYLISLCNLHAFQLMVTFMAPILFLSSLCHEFNIQGTLLNCCSKKCASLQGIQKLVCTI